MTELTQEEQIKRLTSITTPLVGILKIKGHIHGSNKGKYRYLFQPYQFEMPSLLVSTNINRTSTPGEVIALVKYTEWKAGERYPSGQMIQKIGSTINKEDILTSWIYYYQLEPSLKVPGALKEIPMTRSTEILHKGTLPSLRSPVYSIDPPGCVDVDDAFQYETTTNTKGQVQHHLTVHITSVGDLVETLVPYLHNKAFSLYLPDVEGGKGSLTHHMLPSHLVEELSLLTGKERLTVALVCQFSAKGELIHHEFQLNRITNSRQLTYQQVDSFISSKVTYWTELKEFISLVRQANPIFKDDDSQRADLDSHLIIETMMILYNHLGTKFLIQNKLDPVIRVHPPCPKTTSYPEQLDGSLKEFLTFLDYQSAYYGAFSVVPDESREHFGLGIKNYGHLTSPMRRLVDAYNQALILQIITNTCSPHPEASIHLETINEIEKRQRRFYRRCEIYRVASRLPTDCPVKAQLYVYEQLPNGFYRVYWPKYKLSSKVKVGVNDPPLELFSKISAEVAIIHNPMPRLRMNLS